MQTLTLDSRPRQLPMKVRSCGSQPANISLINRREGVSVSAHARVRKRRDGKKHSGLINPASAEAHHISRLSTAGPSRTPASISPTMAGWPKRSNSRPSRRAATISSNNLVSSDMGNACRQPRSRREVVEAKSGKQNQGGAWYISTDDRTIISSGSSTRRKIMASSIWPLKNWPAVGNVLPKRNSVLVVKS